MRGKLSGAFVLIGVMLLGPVAHAGHAHDLLGHDTDSMYFGAGGGDAGSEVMLLFRVYGVEVGGAAQESTARALEGVDQLPGDDPLATSSSFFVGVSPVTFGSWLGSKKKSADEFDMWPDLGYAQPYLHYKRTKLETGGTSSVDESVVLGARAFLAHSLPLRFGLYAQTELWGPKENSLVSGGLLVGTGNYEVDGKDPSAMPSPIRTVVSFAVLALLTSAVGLVFGFMEKECSEVGKDCQREPWGGDGAL